MVKLIGSLSRIKPIRAVVIGDLMLDKYTTGRVSRISPEAPVPVLHVQKEESLPGGAGNVALGLVSLGANVKILGRVGPDKPGVELTQLLEADGVDTDGLIIQRDYETPIKNRLIGESQHMIRIDFETIAPLTKELEEELLEKFEECKPDIVAISDYAKGLLSDEVLQKIIYACKEKKIPVIIDPKGSDFLKYNGASMIKPNLSEAYAAAKLPKDAPLDEVAKILLKQTLAEMLLITRSQEGMSLFTDDGKEFHFPVKTREVTDVTGAGDTVLIMLTIALANQLPLSEAVELANFAAGLSIERLGCARVTLGDLAERLLEVNSANKIFDEGHLFALKQTLKEKEFIVLGLGESQQMSTSLFQAFRQLKSQGKLIIYLSADDPDPEFISLLSSLSEVDFIILKSDSLAHLSEMIHPTQVYILEADQLVALDHPKLLLNRLAAASV